MNQNLHEFPVTDEVKRKLAELKSMQDEPLKHGGGGGTSAGMDMMDAKISAAEARVDTKFEQLRGDLKDFATKSTVWGAAATIIAVVLAAIAFGGDRFDAGMGLADKQAVQMQRDAKQDQDVAAINQKLDKLIEQTQKK